ncbi:MAG: glycosyltransferase family 39 protein [Acidobacteria bacterium]|uniref:Glycosyltransferase family 39 protein n=1 Tax=Candidatus Polarisedimenticola svalbardensis TaxID=2886004 RepID=A0A8J7CE97_9BACT|nr:glycosyltransferase family 39 protein [Candidatus Polarisedimenticola svalbardensis]
MRTVFTSMTSGISHRPIDTAVVVLIFVFALVIRLAYNSNTVVDNPVRADARKYVTYAMNLTHLGIYSQDYTQNPAPDCQVTPGYPLFLAAMIATSDSFDEAYRRILFVQALLGALTVAMAFALARSFLPTGPAGIAAGLTAISPHLITTGGYLLTETLFTTLLLGALLALVMAAKSGKVGILITASVCFGIAALVRPSMLLFPVFIIPLVLLRWPHRNRVLTCLILICGVLICWMPWTLYSRLTVPPDSAKAGLASAAFAMGTYPDLIYKDPRYRGYPYYEDSEYQKMSSSFTYTLQVLRVRASEAPSKYLKWYTLGKPAMFWAWDILVGAGGIHIYPVITSPYTENVLARASSRIMELLHPILLSLTALGLLAMIPTIIRRPKSGAGTYFAPAIPYLAILYFTLLHAALTPLPRYAIPLKPLLYATACHAAYTAWLFISSSRESRRVLSQQL